MTTDPQVAEATRLAGQVLDEVEKAVVGKREALMLVMAAVLAKGHVLLEDFPGLGKTLAARSLATALGLVAAIPAVVIYNHLTRSITAHRALLGDASGKMSSAELDRLARMIDTARKSGA